MKNSKLRRALLLFACAVLLVCLSVGATLAYLQAETKSVKNTFTVGDVSFDEEKDDPDTPEIEGALDEAKVNEKGEPVKNTGTEEEPTWTECPIEEAPRVDENTYKLYPAHTYVKDPTVHLDEESDELWLFVKVINPITAIEVQGDENKPTIAKQMETLGWKQLTDANGANVENVFYYETTIDFSKTDTPADYKVFENFYIQADLEESDLQGYAGKQIEITAYIIQADGFETPYPAWQAGGFN